MTASAVIRFKSKDECGRMEWHNMKKELSELNKTANSLGFDLSLFPGIPIAAIPLFFIFNDYKNSLFDFLGLNIQFGYQQTIIILILTLIASIVIYEISGWCLDWIYDGFYPQKKNRNSELNKYINLARQKWIIKNHIYKSVSVSIYQPTLEKVEKDDETEYKKIKGKLAVSKLLRIIVIPTLILGILKITNKDIVLGIVCVIIAVIFLFISFKYRAEHSKRLYRWFINQTIEDGAKGSSA